MNNIETKEIRGLSIKNFIAIIGATIAIVSTILVTKNSIEAKITGIINTQETYGKINDMNFKIYDVRFKGLQDQVDEYKKIIDDLQQELEDKKIIPIK